MSDGEVRIGYLADMSGTYRDLAGPGGLTAMEMAVADFGGSVNGAPSLFPVLTIATAQT